MTSSNAAAARGDALETAFDRRTLHYRKRIPDLQVQGIVCRPLVWTADGRAHPAVTRTLQYAADIASCHNGQQMSAKALQHRWKHEIQIALLRRRAVMTRAVLPDTTVRERWFLAGLTDTAASHWVRTPPLDGGDDEHAETGTGTTAPDDDKTTSAPSPASKLQPSRPPAAISSLDGPARAGTKSSLSSKASVLAHSPTPSTSSEWCTHNTLCPNRHLRLCS